MKYTIKLQKRFHSGNIFLIGFIVLIFSACESGLQYEEKPEVVEYQLDDDTSLKVILDAEYEHKTFTFNTQEEYENYGLKLESAGEVKVNSQLYHELSHALDPIEIHMLDMNRSIIIGNTKYTADREAIYALDLSKKNSVPELQVYYGLSGEEDLKETEMVYIHRNRLEELADYQFKDPSARALYYEMVESYSDEDVPVLSTDEGRAKCNSSGNSCDYAYYYYNPGGDPYDFKYRNSPSGTIHTAHIRWWLWNQSYRSGFLSLSTWGKGGTITEINRLDGQGWQEMPENDDPIGPYHENGTLDTSKPWTFVKVETDRSAKTRSDYLWRVHAKKVSRSDYHGTESYHSANVRLNNQNQATVAMNDIHLY